MHFLAELTAIEGRLRGPGPGQVDPENVAGLLQNLITGIVGFLTAAGILWFLLQIIISSYAWMTAGGNPEKIAEARGKLINALVGLIIILAALLLVSLIGFLLGFDNILNIKEQLETIGGINKQ